jgi:hypothetical protein
VIRRLDGIEWASFSALLVCCGLAFFTSVFGMVRTKVKSSRKSERRTSYAPEYSDQALAA